MTFCTECKMILVILQCKNNSNVNLIYLKSTDGKKTKTKTKQSIQTHLYIDTFLIIKHFLSQIIIKEQREIGNKKQAFYSDQI